MNKNIVGTALIVGSLLGCTPETSNNKPTREEETITRPFPIDSMKEKKDTIAHEITETINEKVFTYNIKNLIKEHNALVTNSKSYSLVYGLGTQDLEPILKKYNPHLMKNGKSIAALKETSYRNIDSLQVPAVFPSVKDFFLPDIDIFLNDKPLIQQVMNDFFSKYPEAKKKFDEDKTCVITTKLPNGKMGTAYYENGILQLAGPTSIGNGNRYRNKHRSNGEDAYFHARSPQGGFFFTSFIPKKRNKDRDAMTNYLELNATNKQGNSRGLGYHGGQRVTGEPSSHGCFRFINMLSDPLAKKIQLTKWEKGEIKTYGTPCFAAREPYKQELDSVDYYTKRHPNLAKNWLEKQNKIRSEDANPYKEKIAKLLGEKNTDNPKKITDNIKDSVKQEDSTKLENSLKNSTIKNEISKGSIVSTDSI